jgi:subtilisin family serine protease
MNKTWSYKWVNIVIVMVSTFCWIQITKASEISSVPEVHDFTVVAADAVYAPGELLVRFAPKANGIQRNTEEKLQILSSLGGATIKRNFTIVPGLCLVKLPTGKKVEDALKTFNNRDGIFYAEPNYKIYLASTEPDDPKFDELWGMHNTGQTGGTENADINAPEAWDIATDSDVIVAVLDTGIYYEHPDLAANMWINPGEDYPPLGVVGPEDFNEVDDDGNGYEDDIRGWDFPFENNDPDDLYDCKGHGTHVAGIIGAVGNNNEGVVGVCWDVKIMNLKIFPVYPDTDAFISDAGAAIEYGVDNGAKVLNNSWVLGTTYSGALKDKIDYAGASGVLFVAAAGNDWQFEEEFYDIDETPVYPGSYDSSNIITVMATDHDDNRSDFSLYGASSVDLGAPGGDKEGGAPGSDILSCKNKKYGCPQQEMYVYSYGTSMATPHVSGACALVWSVNPSLSHLEVKGIILSTVDVKEQLEDDPDPEIGRTCVTGGRLNVHRAVDAASHYARAFCVKNNLDERVAWFDNLGNLFLKGTFTSGEEIDTAPSGSFIIASTTDPTVAYIDNEGNMCVEGTLSELSGSCEPEGDAFIIKNSSNTNVACIDFANGDLCLTGILYENVNP